MSLQTAGTLLPAAGGMIHAMHGGGDGTITTQSVSMLPAAGGTIHAMHGGGSLLPIAGGTIHAMSGGDGGFMQTDISKTLLPSVYGPSHPIHARSGGFKGGQRTITHLGDSYTLNTLPEERIGAKEPYPTDSNEYKILHSLGLEDLYKLDRGDMSGTQQEYDVLKAIYDGKCNLNSSLGSLADCEAIRRIIHTLALELKQSIAFSMNIFNEADRAAANAAKSLQNAAKEKMANAILRGEPDEEEYSDAKVLRKQEEAARAALKAALEEKEKKEAAGDNIQAESKEPLSEEDYARIAIAATMANSMQSEEPSADGKPDSDKPEDPFHIASIASIAAIHDPSSLPVPVATVEDEEEPTGEDDARIAVAAIIALKQPPQSKKVKPEEPPIDPATDPNGYIAQKKIKEAEALLELGEKQDKLQSLRISLQEATDLERAIPEYPVVPYEHSSNINSLQHFNEVQYRNATLSIIDSIKTMIQETEQSIIQLEEKVEQTKKDREKAEQDYQHDAEVVKQTLTEWMKQQFEHLEQNVQKAREEEDSAVFQVDRVENDISFNNLSSIIEQSQKDLTTSWKPAAYTKWRDARKIIREYLNRAGLHRLYKDTYLEKYNASAKVFILESKHKRLEDISKGWLLNVEIPELKIHDNPFKNALQQDLKSRIEKIEQQLRENPASVDPAAVIHMVQEADHALESVAAVPKKIIYNHPLDNPLADHKWMQAISKSSSAEDTTRLFFDLFTREEVGPHIHCETKNNDAFHTYMTNNLYRQKVRLTDDFEFKKDMLRVPNLTLNLVYNNDAANLYIKNKSLNLDTYSQFYDEMRHNITPEELDYVHSIYQDVYGNCFMYINQVLYTQPLPHYRRGTFTINRDNIIFEYINLMQYTSINKPNIDDPTGLCIQKTTVTIHRTQPITGSVQYDIYDMSYLAKPGDTHTCIPIQQEIAAINQMMEALNTGLEDLKEKQKEKYDPNSSIESDASAKNNVEAHLQTVSFFKRLSDDSKAIDDLTIKQKADEFDQEIEKRATSAEQFEYVKTWATEWTALLDAKNVELQQTMTRKREEEKQSKEDQERQITELNLPKEDIEQIVKQRSTEWNSKCERYKNDLEEAIQIKIKANKDYQIVKKSDKLYEIIDQIARWKESDQTRFFTAWIASLDHKFTLKRLYESRKDWHKTHIYYFTEKYEADKKCAIAWITYTEYQKQVELECTKRGLEGFHVLDESLQCTEVEPSPEDVAVEELGVAVEKAAVVNGNANAEWTRLSEIDIQEIGEKVGNVVSSSVGVSNLAVELDAVIAADAAGQEQEDADASASGKASIQLDSGANVMASIIHGINESASANFHWAPEVNASASASARPPNSESNSESNSNSEEPNWAPPPKPRIQPSSVPSLSFSSQSNKPSIAASAPLVEASEPLVEASAPLVDGLIKPKSLNKGRKRTPQYNAIVKELNGLRGKHPKFLEMQALNNALAVKPTQTTQSNARQANVRQANAEENANLNVLQANINGIFANQRPKAPVPIEQQLHAEMARHQQEQKEINALIENEKRHQGITTSRSISEESKPATASVSENTSSSTNIPSSANVIPIQTVPNKPKLPGFDHYTRGINHSSSVKPPAPVPASKSIATAPTAQTAPFEIPQSLMKQQNEFYKSNNGARERYLEKQAKFAAQNAERKKKETSEALVGRRAVEAAEAAKAEAKQKNLTSLKGAPTISGKSVMPAPKSAPQPLPEPQSFNPSSLQNAPPITKMNKAKAKKLEQIRLKAELGQPLTKNEKAILKSQGGTRKKTKQSRKKLQTRKRSSKRSTSKK